MNMANETRNRILAIFLILTAALTVVFWMVWFLVPGGRDALASMPNDPCYVTFENAFPLADGWMSLACLIAAIHLLRGSPRASAWLFMAGSAALFLAGMDILYDIQNGIYLGLFGPQGGAVVVEIAINLGILLIAGWSIVTARRLQAA